MDWYQNCSFICTEKFNMYDKETDEILNWTCQNLLVQWLYYATNCALTEYCTGVQVDTSLVLNIPFFAVCDAIKKRDRDHWIVRICGTNQFYDPVLES